MTDLAVRRQFAPVVKPVALPEPWSAAVISVSAFPVPEPERSLLRNALQRWCAQMMATGNLVAGTWLQMNHLPLDRGARKLSAHGKAWLPMTGLGVWPDRESPRLWTKDDFEEREYGQPLPPLMHTVFHVSAGGKASDHARDEMTGSGTVIYVLHTESSEKYHAAMRELLWPRITEEALRGHSFYIPLLEAVSLRNIQRETLESWMGPASVYIRESVEDGGILIICSLPHAFDQLQLSA